MRTSVLIPHPRSLVVRGFLLALGPGNRCSGQTACVEVVCRQVGLLRGLLSPKKSLTWTILGWSVVFLVGGHFGPGLVASSGGSELALDESMEPQGNHEKREEYPKIGIMTLACFIDARRPVLRRIQG